MGWHSKLKKVREQTKKRKSEDIGSSSSDEYQDDLETRYRVLKSATIPYKKTKLGKIYRLSFILGVNGSHFTYGKSLFGNFAIPKFQIAYFISL